MDAETKTEEARVLFQEHSSGDTHRQIDVRQEYILSIAKTLC